MKRSRHVSLEDTAPEVGFSPIERPSQQVSKKETWGKVIEAINPSTLLKSRKTADEAAHVRQAMELASHAPEVLRPRVEWLDLVGNAGYAFGARGTAIRENLLAKKQFTEQDLLAGMEFKPTDKAG